MPPACEVDAVSAATLAAPTSARHARAAGGILPAERLGHQLDRKRAFMHSIRRGHVLSRWLVPWAALTLLFATILTLRNVLNLPWTQLPQAFLSRGLEALLALLPVVPVVLALTGHRKPRRAAYEVGTLTLAVLGSTLLGLSLRYGIPVLGEHASVPTGFGYVLLGRWFEYSVLGTIIALIVLFHERTASAEDVLHSALLQQVGVEHQLAEARLQSVQAQIEPHFLFNTLANVRRLFQTEPAGGCMMLEQFARYLEVSLPRIRASEVPLGEEIGLIEAYLQIQAIRMGARLNWRIDVADTLIGAAVPPMILNVLVENAIKHGLSPLPEGGRLSIRASLAAGRLRLEVADDGYGFRSHAGVGVGLANIRTRLHLLYGAIARLHLADNAPRGVVATVELPYRMTRAA